MSLISKKPPSPVTLAEVKDIAKTRLHPDVWNYYTTGIDEEHTLLRNEYIYQQQVFHMAWLRAHASMKKYYMVFAILNACFIPIIRKHYVETAKLSLEQASRLFEIKDEGGSQMTWSATTKLARMEDLTAQTHMETKSVDSVEHYENS